MSELQIEKSNYILKTLEESKKNIPEEFSRGFQHIKNFFNLKYILSKNL